MKIQFKRNTTSANAIPSGTSAGEPIWFKDELYVGSVGSGVGGTTTAGTPVKVVGHPTGLSNNTLTLSTTAATYATINGVDMKIALPASDPYTSARTPSSHTHGDIDNSGNVTTSTAVTVANGDALLIADLSASNKLVKSAITFDGSTTGQYLSKAGTWQNVPASENQKVKAGNEEFGANDEVDFVGGNEIGVVGDSNAKTITISSNITHPAPTTGTYKSVTVDAHGHVTAGTNPTTLAGYGITDAKIESNTITLGSASVTPLTAVTAVSATPVASLSGDTLTFKQISQATSAQMSIADSGTTLTFKSAPTSSNKIITETDISGIVGAMVYQGTVGTDGTVTTLPTAAAANKGHVYVVKTAGTYAGKACEIGDMCVSNGSSWDIVSGENQVTNAGATLAFGTTSTIATVDGTDITVTMPGDPNTDEKVTPKAITSGSYPILLTPNASSPTTNGQPNYKANVTIDGSTGKITAGGIIVGSSTGFLKADGNVDNTSYLPASDEHNQTITSKNGSSAAVTFGSDAAVQITSGAGISVTGNDTANTITIAHTNSVTGASVGPSADASPAFGGTFSVPYVTFDNQGHISAASTKTITLPTPEAAQDIKVKQTVFVYAHDTGEFPILASEYDNTDWGTQTNVTAESKLNKEITINKDGYVTAAGFKTHTGTGLLKSDGTVDTSSYLTTEHNQKIKNGTTTFGDDAIVNLTATSPLKITATTTSGSEALAFSHEGPGTGGADITAGTAGTTSAQTPTAGTTFNIPYVTYNAKGHITAAGTSTVKIPDAVQPNNGTLTIQKDNSAGVQVFSANTSTNETITVNGGTNITLTQDTSTADNYKLTIAHSSPTGAATTTSGFYKFSTDSQGHVNGTTDVAWSDISGLAPNTVKFTDENVTPTTSSSGSWPVLLTPQREGSIANGHAQYNNSAEHGLVYNIDTHTLTIAGHIVYTDENLPQYPTVHDGKLQLQVGSGSAVDSGFNADSSSDVALKFSATATGATFAVDSSTKEISISAIDGGTF